MAMVPKVPAPDASEETVPLPPHGPSGFLPPHLGERFVLRGGCSPYRITPSLLVERFATSKKRVALLRGLFRLRADARQAGIETGFQWLGGSFVDDRADPNDLDVVTFYQTPAAFRQAGVANVVARYPNLFRPTAAKETYGCDAYFISLALRRKSYRLVSLWYALFSHDRHTLTWKGFVELGIASADEAEAEAALRARAQELGA
jgi:hypothetical protein